MTKEQEQSTSPAVIAVRAKKGLALATGNPLDKIELNPKEVEKNGVQSEETLIERVVSLMQRRKRALQMKRSKPRITRARNIKKTRLATQDQLMRRAMRMAKTLLRKRAAGARGTSYSKLSSAQKINIDRQIEPRTKNIKAMAVRMMPRVKAGEMRRLNAVRTHKSTKGVYGNIQNLTQSYQPVIYSKILGEKVSSEDLNAMFTMYEGRFVSALTAPIRGAAKVAGATVATVAALQSPATAAAALTGVAGYGLKKLSDFGKQDPQKKKEKASSEMDKINLATAKEKLAQQKLRTTAMKAGQSKQKPANVTQKSTPKPVAKPQPVAKPVAKPVATAQPATEPVSQPATQSSIIIPEPSRARSQQMQKNLEPAPKTLSQIRQQRQSAAAKVARQQMGLVNHMELEDGTPLSEKSGGLWDNIHAKRKRIKSGSGERMRKPGSEGAPTKQNFIDAAESIEESFIVDRASGYSGVYTAKDLGITMQGGFALHPSVEEEIGAGFEGTNKLTNKYKKDTPGEAVEAFARMMRAKRKANTPC
jgi:outer membrane biosynthesis protein TonB